MADSERATATGEGPEGFAAKLGHDFADPGLLIEALTHRSAAQPDLHRFGYERLEFLGDRVLGLVIADLLMARYPHDPEGHLSRRLTGLVRKETLAEVASRLQLGRYLILADSEARGGGRENSSIQADACEAVIGALYLDGGLAAARSFIDRYWQPLLDAAGKAARDPKTRLQEWAQARRLDLPAYRVISETGPAHDPRFTIEVTLAGVSPDRASAEGSTKRQAEQAAAALLLAELGGEGDE